MPYRQASQIHLSPRQQELLERMVHRTTSAQRLVTRGQIILEAAEGISNSSIARHL
jgi:putative transposase